MQKKKKMKSENKKKN